MQSPPSARDSPCSTCTAEVITDLNWNLSRPDGHDEGGEVVVAPAVASLGAVVLHHLALVHHPLERHLRVYAGGDLATPWSTLICSDEERQLTSVMVGTFSVEQAVFTLASQPLRSAARSVKFFVTWQLLVTIHRRW